MDDKPIPYYFFFGGMPMLVTPVKPAETLPPADPLSIDMVLNGIQRASETSCDHGVSLTEHCSKCEPLEAA